MARSTSLLNAHEEEELSSVLKTMPDARNKDNVVWLNPVANNIAASAKANDDLPNVAIPDGLADFGKMLDSLKRRLDRSDCTRCGIGIFNVEKLANAFHVRDSLGREQDHMTLRGWGRGSSLLVPQESIQALTSAAGMASLYARNLLIPGCL